MASSEENSQTPDSGSIKDSTTSSDTKEHEGGGENKSIIREYAEAIVIAIILALFIRVFVVQAFKIPSGSMIPTLLIGDHILVSKMAYGLQWPTDCKIYVGFPPVTCYSSNIFWKFGDPQRGDIIVFRYPEDEEKDFIKRIIGLPGDTIQARNKVVYINGQPLHDEAYTQRIDQGIIDGHINQRDNFGPITVPENSYFVMGDNRDQSLDSRFWGFVKMDKIKGKAFMSYWSWNGQGSWVDWVRWDRIGKLIH